MLISLIALGLAAAPPGFIVEGSRGAADDRRVLVAALRAPERARQPGRAYFCFDDAISRPGETRRVCRTRQAWR